MTKWPASPGIFREIKKSSSILLHCHPSPDPDSVGSALAMKFALESLDKKVTVIQGDSEIPESFRHFPGAEEIVPKNYFEIDPGQYDLFIVLDSSLKYISGLNKITFPPNLVVANIDHHKTNTNAGPLTIVDPSYPANCLLLFDLFREWGLEIDSNIATNLFIGIYTDTGGFKYEGVDSKTFEVAAELAEQIEDIPLLISKMENSTTQGFIRFQAAALSSISTFGGGILAISSVPYSLVQEKGMVEDDIAPSRISSFMRTVPEWKIAVSAVEIKRSEVRLSFRSSDSKTYDISKLAAVLGGGGHKAAAGATVSLPLNEAIVKVVDEAKRIYNLS